jgi:hypothetical protein
MMTITLVSFQKRLIDSSKYEICLYYYVLRKGVENHMGWLTTPILKQEPKIIARAWTLVWSYHVG